MKPHPAGGVSFNNSVTNEMGSRIRKARVVIHVLSMPYIRADGNIEHGRHGDGNPGNRLVPYAIAVCFVIYALGEAEDGGVFNNLMHV